MLILVAIPVGPTKLYLMSARDLLDKRHTVCLLRSILLRVQPMISWSYTDVSVGIVEQRARELHSYTCVIRGIVEQSTHFIHVRVCTPRLTGMISDLLLTHQHTTT
jgi:hypothetical protein